jgi:hypothetical protein
LSRKRVLSVDEAFLRFLERLDEKARLEREQGLLPQLIDEDALDLDPEPA